MRSIIDEIAQAEKQADEIRQSAVADGRDRIAAAVEASKRALETLDETERKKTQQALADAEAEGEKMADGMKRTIEQDADALCKNAEAHLDDTVRALMDKVRGAV